jgi:putative hydrolase of the HAD superfamily
MSEQFGGRESAVRSAVLFDLYDTLVRVEYGPVMAARDRIAAACNVDVEQFRTLWNQSLAERSLGALGTLEDEITAMLGTLCPDVDAALVAELAAGDRAAWAEAAQLYPDAHPTLAALRERGFALGLVSNCSCQAADVIASAGLDQHLQALALSFELGVAKPDPAMFLAAAEQLDVAPAQCVYVADGSEGELETAKRLGMYAIWVDRPHRRGRNPTPAAYDVRIDELGEILTIAELTRPVLSARDDELSRQIAPLS